MRLVLNGDLRVESDNTTKNDISDNLVQYDKEEIRNFLQKAEDKNIKLPTSKEPADLLNLEE